VAELQDLQPLLTHWSVDASVCLQASPHHWTEAPHQLLCPHTWLRRCPMG